MKKHFVTFYSAGTFFPEETTKEISQWDVPTAVEMSKSIIERYSSRPFGFRFITKERGDDDMDSKVTQTGPMYYLGGKVMTLADVEAMNDPGDAILLSNMRINQIERIVRSHRPWKTSHQLEPGDVVLEAE